VVWINEWFNPPKETEAATSLINGGADVLFQNTDSPSVLKTAERWASAPSAGTRT
jgi:simple sugar transport system substrate-binding protein